jgi:23S rRNA (guanine745-N1)-methyltransferase
VIGDVRALLTCPVCGSGFPVTPAGPPPQALRCANGHSFDIARQGYVNLLPGGARPGTADTAEMVAAREAFLSAGHYAPLAAGVAALAAAAWPCPVGHTRPCVLDAGAGPGYYLAAVLDRLRDRPGGAGPPGGAGTPGGAGGPDGPGGAGGAEAAGLAMDISARALRRAARARAGIGAVVWDIWRPFPVRDGAVSLILNVFAPRNGPEFRRVLRADGALIVVTPGPRHLAELTRQAGLLAVDPRKDERVEAALGASFALAGTRDLTVPLRLTRPEAAALVAMGPAARHTDPGVVRQRLAAAPEPIGVTAAFRLSRYRPA